MLSDSAQKYVLIKTLQLIKYYLMSSRTTMYHETYIILHTYLDIYQNNKKLKKCS